MAVGSSCANVQLTEIALSTASLATFGLQSELRRLRHFAVHQVSELLAAYDRDADPRLSPLALEACDRLVSGARTLMDLPVVDEDEVLSERTVTRLARLAAVTVHAHASARYQAGRLAPMAEDPAFILRAIERAERRYAALLLDTRTAARSGRIERLVAVLEATLDAARGDIAYAAIALAGKDTATRSTALAAIRLAHVTRRMAMLSAASLLLMFRLTTTAKAAGLRRVAESRRKVARPWAEMLAAVPRVTGASIGDRVRLQAHCTDIAWVEEGDGFTRITVDAGQVSELRLARRNAQRVGVAKGSLLYLAGTVAEDAGTTFLQVGLVPVATHSADIWEDYLISEVRPAYDLVPGSIDMLWELPDLKQVGGRNELHGRL